MDKNPRDSNADLERALREAELEVSSKGNRSVHQVRPVGTIPDSAVERVDVLQSEAMAIQTGPGNLPRAARGRKAYRAAALLVVLIAAGGAHWWYQPKPPAVPPDPLHRLASAIEAYRGLHGGQLPERLGGLAEFPADAIEWPAEYWNARNLQGLDEVIYFRGADNSYRIVLRRGSDIRLYSSIQRQTKLIGAGSAR